MRAAASLLVMAMASAAGAADMASGADERQSPEASIAHARRDGIRDWQVVDDSTLLILDRRGDWYRAKLESPAPYLPFMDQLVFTTTPSGRLERSSAIVVRGQHYSIVSLTRSEPPGKTRN